MNVKWTNDWEQRKFSDFTWKAGKRNKEDLDLVPYAITNEHGFIRQCDAHDDFGYMKDTDRKAYILFNQIHLLIIRQELMWGLLDTTKAQKM